MFLRSLASGCGSFVKTDGFEVTVDSELMSTGRVLHDRKHVNKLLISGRYGSVELFLQQFLCRFGEVGAV